MDEIVEKKCKITGKCAKLAKKFRKHRKSLGNV